MHQALVEVAPADTRSAVAHLLRRAGFGADAATIDELSTLGYPGAVDRVCDFVSADVAADGIESPSFDPDLYVQARDGDEEAKRAATRQARVDRQTLILWWLQRMVVAEKPVREKLALLWHDHFATSIEKVKFADLMQHQYRTLYDLGPGRFDVLLHAVARDPAMLIWLDGRLSTAGAPNENFARELLELFTLGHGGHHGAQPYAEADVAEVARALTGWTIDREAFQGTFVARRHDGEPKTVLGVTAVSGLDDVVAVATGHPACAPHVVARLWSRIARPAEVDDPVVVDLAAAFAADLDVAGLARRMFLHPAFLDAATRSALLKSPVEYVVGTARALGVQLDQSALGVLNVLGQLPFVPPDVSGWPANEAWISTSSARMRLQFARAMTEAADLGALEDASSSDRPDVVAHILGVDRWAEGTRLALNSAADDPSTLLTLALVAPEHLLA